MSAAMLGAFALYFLLLGARLVRSYGPVAWSAPATVVSNGPPSERHAVPFLLFLREVRPLLPPGGQVAVRGPDAETESALDDLIAVGQLPQSDVVHWRGALDRDPPPRFLAVHLGGCPDDRYRVAAAFADGCLCERKP